MKQNQADERQIAAAEELNRITSLVRTGFNLATCLIISLIGFILTEPLTSLLINRPEMTSLVRITMVLLVYPLSTAAGGALLGFGDMKGFAVMDVIRQAFRALISSVR